MTADEREDEREDDEESGAEKAEEKDGEKDEAPRPAPSRGRRRLAATVSVFGELLITAGLVLGLFVVYSLWWTNVVANQEAKRDSDAVREQWAASDDDATGGDDAAVPPEYDPEDGIGFLHVPTMSGDEILVKKGIDLDILNGGVAGYYDEPVESALPWDDEGNFSLAAHRDGHGAKFHDIQRIEEGDPIVFETENTWYIYRAYAILPETSKFNTEVLDPIPEESGATEAGRYITLTTCTPLYTSRHRYIVWGELERTEHVNAERTPPEELRAN
ncbi:class E sortase [Streptomyces radicis]|uniref:class E sortase n=1 Tax=Streptomyces radicis TaxID=1750517 RepID=UPI0038B6173D